MLLLKITSKIAELFNNSDNLRARVFLLLLEFYIACLKQGNVDLLSYFVQYYAYVEIPRESWFK